MATSYTENYHLPQWAAEDQVLREEFNQAWATLDEETAAAQAKAEQKGCVAGTYTGNGKTMTQGGQLIYTGFRPKFVIISRGWVSSSGPDSHFVAVGEARMSELDSVFSIEDTGFVVATGVNGFVTLNTNGTTYSFTAFR